MILQYHHFAGDTPPSTSVTPEQLAQHLAYLRDNDFQVLPLDEVATALGERRPLPERCLALSVDDAYVSVYREAFPRLRELGWPLTVFVSPGSADASGNAYLSWQQMREMAAAGVRFENHGYAHDHLVRRREGESESEWRQRVGNDIRRAQERIEEELGRRPRLFAYPYGEYDSRLQAVVRELGLVGLGQQSGPAWFGSDPQALPRFPMAAGFAELAQFRVKVNTLPLPLEKVLPADPLLPVDEWRPVLSLFLRAGSDSGGALRCFVNGQPIPAPSWGDGLRVDVRSPFDLPVGRSRYTCTMPGDRGERFHWYSHPWIRRHVDGGWYRE